MYLLKKRTVLFALFACISTLGIAQTDFRKGFILTNARDTTFGLVDFREGPKGYALCTFKSSGDQKPKVYSPDDIAGYGFINDKFFESREITSSDGTTKTVFLETLIRGKLSLYRYEKEFLLDKQGQTLTRLSNEAKETYVGSRRMLRNSNQYIGMLTLMMSDCPHIKVTPQKVKLYERSLTEIVEDYNRCSGTQQIIFKARKSWLHATIGATAGLNISSPSFSVDPGTYRQLSGSFTSSKTPAVGFSMGFLSPRLTERISFHIDMLYIKSTYYNFNMPQPIPFTRNYVTIGVEQLKVPMGLRYTFPARKYTPHLTVGLSSTFHLKSYSSWVQEREAGGVVVTEETEAVPMKKNQFGFWGGLGVSRTISKKVTSFLELRYELTDGVARSVADPEPYLTSQLTNFQIIVGIRTR